jgi:RNA polymerase sigma factor (sigma-70 family)
VGSEGVSVERRLLRIVRREPASPGAVRREGRAIVNEIFFAVRWMVRSKLRVFRTQAMDGMSEEDLVSEIVLALIDDDCRALEKFDPERGSLRSFVATFAEWRCADIHRRHSRRGDFAELESAPEPRDPAYSPEDFVRGRQAERAVRKHVLSNLSANERLAFARYYDDELPGPEFARTMAWSPAQVYRFTYRVRTLARAFLRDDA